MPVPWNEKNTKAIQYLSRLDILCRSRDGTFILSMQSYQEHGWAVSPAKLTRMWWLVRKYRHGLDSELAELVQCLCSLDVLVKWGRGLMRPLAGLDWEERRNQIETLRKLAEWRE